MVTERQPRWKARPVFSATLRFVALLLPLAASIAASVGVARLLPTPRGSSQTVLWWVAFLSAAVGVLAIVDRLARRLLPLAALLSLSLAFPHRVPNRFRVALRAGSTRELNRRINEARSRGLSDEPARAAETILLLSTALGKHDRLTRGHSERVRALTDLLAVEMNLSEADKDLLRWAALLHDVGKIDVDAELLNKPGAPEADEWETIRTHPEAGMQLAEPLAGWLGPWVRAIGEHHERFDGRGYPGGLAGEDISIAGRIVAVADAYETMTAGRPYRRPMSVEAARLELANETGRHFDPAVVRAFLNLSIGRLWRVAGIGAWVGSLAIIPRPVASFGRSSGGASAGTAAAVATAVALGSGLVAPTKPAVLGEHLRRPPIASAPVPADDKAAVEEPPAVSSSPAARPAPRSPSPRPSSPPESATPSPAPPSPTASPTPSPGPSDEPEPTCIELLLALIGDAPGSLTIDRISEVVDCLVPGGGGFLLR